MSNLIRSWLIITVIMYLVAFGLKAWFTIEKVAVETKAFEKEELGCNDYTCTWRDR